MGKSLMAETFKKNVIIDVKDHLVGRVCSVVAKELLRGNHVTLVRCEGIYISGNFYRNKLIMLDKMKKRTATNPKDGPFHHRAPCMVVKRMIRGMLPNRTGRGTKAFARLSVYDGCPPPFDNDQAENLPTWADFVMKLAGNTKESLKSLKLNVLLTQKFGTRNNRQLPQSVTLLSSQSLNKLLPSIKNSPLWATKKPVNFSLIKFQSST